ncbi:MAG TPA: NADH-quinone oxidoreductase subunit NuoG [Rhodocyclaceae bacterium]|nr:NADH-quinone oxidoreductase subunit NuoG [Rhodocyclaceae bacterium]HRQ45429.1 NADH-quinone oxidoreductase subunit NuoG [Rhodocyclaceae bacterium]
MLEIEIDGKQVTVPDGSTIMDAAARAETYIPHFCYHKKLSIAASCRMCLVQVEKAPKPLPACATPVTNGMKVWTHSELAIKAQKGVMEFLLINHPLDCPICDQGGECQLQDLAVGYGAGQSRYQEEKRVVFNKNLGPLVSTDMTRCINCTRCVRFTQEIAGEMELGQAFRGEHAEIMPFIEKTVDSELSGNIIDLCPVGALTSKPFRFSARTWELSRRKSVSPHDSLGSNLIVQVKHDTVRRVLPLENESINECWLSDKDRFSYEALSSEERLAAPMIRQGGEWKRVDWQTALEFAANGLRDVVAEHGGEALGALLSPHSTVEELYLAQKVVRALGSENVDFRLRQADFAADGKRRGAPWLGMPIAGVADLDRLLVIGSFLRKDTPLLAQRVRQAAKRGLDVSVINPTADDWLLPVRQRALVAPSAIAATMLEVAFALAESKGLSVSDAFAPARPTRISDEARAIADSLAGGRKVAIWLGNLAVQSQAATAILQLAQELARLSGGVFGVIGEAANSVGGYLVNAVPGDGGLNARTMLEQPRMAYILSCAEPDRDFADPTATLQALDGARLVVALSSFDSSSLRQVADVLLPVSPFAETSGTFVNCEGTAQSFAAVARPRAETRPAWKVWRVLGNLLSLPGFGYNDSESVLAEALGNDFAARLGNTVDEMPVSLVTSDKKRLERVSDVPIHFADPLVRRADALQRTRDAAEPVARASSATLAGMGVVSGDRVRLKQGTASTELAVVADDCVAAACVRVPAAHAATASLGPMSGEISMERV